MALYGTKYNPMSKFCYTLKVLVAIVSVFVLKKMSSLLYFSM